MKAIGINNRQLRAWHNTVHRHPIFNPDYARENLLSLAATFVMAYLYVATVLIALHLWILNGLLEAETLTWLIIESNARNVMLDVPDAVFFNKSSVALVLILSIIITMIARWSFGVFKASLHPGALVKAKRYLATIESYPASLLPGVTTRLIRKEAKNVIK